MAAGDLSVQAISPTEVKNNDAVVFIGFPKYDASTCKFVTNNIGDLYMIPYASKVDTPNKAIQDSTEVVNQIDKKTLTTGRERSVEVTTKRITGSEIYKNVIKKIVDMGWTHPNDLVQITIFTEYEYSCQTPDKDKNVRTATGKIWGQSYIGPLDYDNSWFSGDVNKIVEQKFTVPTYTQMIPETFTGLKGIAQAVLDGKYPYGNIAVYDPSKTGMAKFITTK